MIELLLFLVPRSPNETPEEILLTKEATVPQRGDLITTRHGTYLVEMRQLIFDRVNHETYISRVDLTVAKL